MRYVLEQSCGYIRESVATAVRVRHEAGEAQPGSTLAGEYSTATGRRRVHVMDAVSIARFRMATVEDHLLAIARMIPDPGSIYAVYTLARTVAEVSARAWWLLDADIGHDGRAQRGLAERAFGLRESGKLPIPGISDQSKERLAHLHSRAQAEGLSIAERHRRPAAGTLLRQVMGDDQDAEVLGAHTYKLLSAFTHGTSYALQSLILGDSRRDSSIDGMAQVQLGTSADREAVVLLMAFIPYMHAVKREAILYGWSSQPLLAQLVYTSSEIRRHLNKPEP